MNKEELYKSTNEEANEDKSLKELIQEIAEEEGMTYEETLKLFKKGLKQANGFSNRKKDKVKLKARRKQAKLSRKRNR